MSQVARKTEEILPEDRVTNSLIKLSQGKTSVEVPYSNYGERGYVDLVINYGGATRIIELKSNPRTANSVLRQFKKMKSNFLQGTDYQHILPEKEYWLVFTASQQNLQHIKSNKEMYLSLESPVYIADEDGRYKPVFKNEQINNSISNLKGISLDGLLICPYCGKEYKMEAYHRKHVQKCNHGSNVKKISKVSA